MAGTKPPGDPALRAESIETLMVEKGLLDLSGVDELIQTFEHRIGPRNGAKVVARACTTSWFAPSGTPSAACH